MVNVVIAIFYCKYHELLSSLIQTRMYSFINLFVGLKHKMQPLLLVVVITMNGDAHQRLTHILIVPKMLYCSFKNQIRSRHLKS